MENFILGILEDLDAVIRLAAQGRARTSAFCAWWIERCTCCQFNDPFVHGCIYFTLTGSRQARHLESNLPVCCSQGRRRLEACASDAGGCRLSPLETKRPGMQCKYCNHYHNLQGLGQDQSRTGQAEYAPSVDSMRGRHIGKGDGLPTAAPRCCARRQVRTRMEARTRRLFFFWHVVGTCLTVCVELCCRLPRLRRSFCNSCWVASASVSCKWGVGF